MYCSQNRLRCRPAYRLTGIVASLLLLRSSFEGATSSEERKSGDWRTQGIIFLDHSVNARVHTVPVQAVHLTDGYWYQRRKVITEHSLPTMLALLEDHGVVDNFRRLSGRKNVPRRGRLSTDSDLYKWMEAASWAIASNETSDGDKNRLKGEVQSLVGEVLAAQEPSGYLNTYYTGDKLKLRWTELTKSHEDYCLGHLIQAAIAWYRATGNRDLLDGAIRFADYVVENFGPAPKRPMLTGHPELEMALVELYRTTGNSAYLEFTRYLFSGVERDRLKLKDSDIRYMFSGRPFTSHTELEGHAVRALYAASGATDFFAESGDPAYKQTLDVLWRDLTLRKMYITGGVGSRSNGESFGDPYELPNDRAYAETCAAVANLMWNFRMLSITGQASYTDVLERVLFNGANSGVSLAGTLYCYRNPLAASNTDRLRNPWYDVTCCPPNIERLLEALPGYFYGTGRGSLFVHLYGSSLLDWHLEDGTALKLTQTTGYPWSGDVQMTLNLAKPSVFALNVRWPAWSPSLDVQINGQPVDVKASQRGTYVSLARSWHSGDTVKLTFAMPASPVSPNPKILDTVGKLAYERGPLVYAAEQIDQGGAALADLSVRPNTAATVENRKDLLGGIVSLKVPGFAAEKINTEEPLYLPGNTWPARARKPLTLTLVPFYAIANRELTAMEVWIPVARPDAPVVPAISPTSAGAR